MKKFYDKVLLNDNSPSIIIRLYDAAIISILFFITLMFELKIIVILV